MGLSKYPQVDRHNFWYDMCPSDLKGDATLRTVTLNLMTLSTMTFSMSSIRLIAPF
jgi:hypothetical protein